MRTVHTSASIDYEKCKLCKTCFNVCPTLAISLTDSKPKIDVNLCFGCKACESRCPHKAITMKQREKPLQLHLQVEDADKERIGSLCLRAGYHQKQIICFCTRIRAGEVAAAVLKGAKTPAEISRLTGIRSGCTVECIEPQLRILDVAGIKVEDAPGWQWYGKTPTIMQIPKTVQNKFKEHGFYFEDDIKLREKLLKAQ